MKTPLKAILKYPTFVELALVSGDDSFFLLTEDRLSFLTLSWVTILCRASFILPGFRSSVIVVFREISNSHFVSSSGAVSELELVSLILPLLVVSVVVVLVRMVVTVVFSSSEAGVVASVVVVISSHSGLVSSTLRYSV